MKVLFIEKTSKHDCSKKGKEKLFPLGHELKDEENEGKC